MKEQGLWGHFDSLINDLQRRLDSPRVNKLPASYKELIEIFLSSTVLTPKIFYPFSGNVITALDDVDDAVKPLIRLPYPRTLFFTESPFGKSAVLATDLDIAPEGFSHPHQHPKGSIGFSTALRHEGIWMVLPTVGIFYPSIAGTMGVEVKILENGMEAEVVNRYAIRAEKDGDDPVRRLRKASTSVGISTIVNACVLLNTHNTTQETVKAPKFLNQKRVKKGKRPLLDYKILVVDGERWDSDDAARSMVHGDGSGKRSHLRRGHIRHLANGKITYVRATYVHGSAEGFIEKDYFIGGKNAIHQQAATV